MQSTRKLVIFSDLDGTLLDRDTYSFSGAEEALRRIKEKDIPLVLASSKTRAEIELYRQLLSNNHPFIIENGAAAFIPEGYFPQLPSPLTRKDGYFVIELGLPYEDIRRALARIKERTALPIRGVGDMSPEELAGISKLDLEQARLAVMREYAEPFVLEKIAGEEALTQIQDATRELALKLTVGEKFLHLSGPHSKGELVRRLSVLFRMRVDSVRTVALGDGKNDIEMLAECEIAVVLRKKSGLVDEEILRRVPSALPYEAGPLGWNKAVIDLLEGKLA